MWRHMALTLTTDERAELERRVRSLKIRAEDARRARVILMLANGESYSTIEATVPCYRDYINRWRRRFLTDRLDGLRARYKGQPPTILTAKMDARILAKTQQPPPDGSTHWSTRKLARVLQIHHNLVAKTWQRAGLQPHRFERYMQSNAPDLEAKAADVIGLYINPPDHAAVFAVDEKTAIQALDRLDPVLPLSPGRAERHGFEYDRHGTLSLFAALIPNPARCWDRRCRATRAPRSSISSARLSPRSRRAGRSTSSPTTSRPTRPRPFAPSCWRIRTCASISRRRTHRGSIKSNSGLPRSSAISWRAAFFASVADLARKIRRYIKRYNTVPKPSAGPTVPGASNW